MAGTLLGTLGIGITADLAGLAKGLETASKSLTDFGQKTEKMGKSISDTGTTMTKWVTGPIVAVGAAVTALAVNVGQFADNLMTQSLQTGLSAKSLQEWRYIATLCGVSADAAVTAIYGLSRRMAELENDTGEGAEALAKLGLTFEDIRGKSPEDVFTLLLDRLSTIPDVLERNSIASKTLGLGWKEVAPIIAAGGDEIERLREEAHDLGVVISDEGIKAAADFDNAWDSITAQLAAAKNEMGISLAPMMRDTFVPIIQNTVIPAIKEFGEKLAAIIKWFGDLPDETQKTIIKILALAAVLGPALIVIGKVTTAIGLLGKALGALTAHPIALLILAIGGLATAWATAQDGLDSFGDYWNEFWIDLANSTITIYNKIGDGIAWLINKALDGIKWLTGGLLDLGKVDFADVPLFKSLERIPQIMNGIVDATDAVILRLSVLGDAHVDELIVNLNYLRESLKYDPKADAFAQWERQSRELVDTWKELYPELAGAIEAAFAGTAPAVQTAVTEAKKQIGAFVTAIDEVDYRLALFNSMSTEQGRELAEQGLALTETIRSMSSTAEALLSPTIKGLALSFAALYVVTKQLEGEAIWVDEYSAAYADLSEVVEKAKVRQAEFVAVTGQEDEALNEMISLFEALRVVIPQTELEKINKTIETQTDKMKLAGIGTIEYADGLEVLNGILEDLEDYQRRGVAGLDATIAKLRGTIGPTNEVSVALAELSRNAQVTASEFLGTLSSNIAGAIETFGEGLMTMGETNKQLADDHKATLDQINQDFQDAAGDAAEAREKDIQNLKDNLADGKITQEQYARDCAQIWKEYNTAFDKAEKERDKVLDDEKKAYEDQKVTLGKLVSEIVHTVLAGIARQLLGYAAEHTALALINTALLNFVQAAKEWTAAGIAGAYALGMGVFESAIPFHSGGIVAASLGPEPVIRAKAGEGVFTPEQMAAMGTIDYELMGTYVAAGVADALQELGVGADRPLILQVDGKTFGRIALPLVQREKVRLGLEAV